MRWLLALLLLVAGLARALEPAAEAERCLDPQRLAQLALSSRLKVREAVARNPCASSATLLQLSRGLHLDTYAAKDDRDLLFALLSNPCLPGEAFPLLRAAAPLDWQVADHPNAPLDLVLRELEPAWPGGSGDWTRLSQSPQPGYRRAAARNRATPPEALRKLCERPELHEVLAANPSLPPDLLARLSRDPRAEVRGAVAGNWACPAEILAELARDSASEVVESAQRTRYYRGLWRPGSEGAPMSDELIARAQERLEESFQVHQQKTREQMIQAMKENGMDPAYIYAVEKTGIMPFQETMHLLSEAELERWNAAYEEFKP